MPSVYGPVASWRLGHSLGIDLLLPPKTCTFDCVYCQLGRTINKVSGPEDLNEKVEVDTVVKDLKKMLKEVPLGSIDFVTFSGYGEPTLNLMMGKIIEKIRGLTGDVPIAVLTNASLVSRKDVRMNLKKADLVVAKLDAPNQELFEAINRPAKNLTLYSIIEGLKCLRQEANNRLTLQIMLFRSLRNVDNINEKTIEELARLALTIKPDEVQINTPTRPPSEGYVLPLRDRRLNEISRKFKEILAGVDVVTRISPRPPQAVEKRRVREEEILELLKRRPCRLGDLVKSLGGDEGSMRLLIDELIASNRITSVHFGEDVYYKVIVISDRNF
ncbi:MAG: radical SAM protein [archaeon]|nr:radical SAM protein [archaeon]MCP8306746.1 radical SAM protein [archaeon]